MKIISVVGARPQFIKLAPLSKELRKYHQEIILHTGQHFDDNMSAIFFDQMHIPKPDYNLEISGGTHGLQTGKMLIEIEKVYLHEKPDLVIVFGDTNSTLAGAIAASKLHIPILHIEAGLRSYDEKMPEEQNRILTDRLSTYLACPSKNAIKNLKKEGICKNVFCAGDIMFDAVKIFSKRAEELKIFEKFSLKKKEYLLLTLHRASNTDNEIVLKEILDLLGEQNEKIVFPIHPRTLQKIKDYKIRLNKNISLIDPVGYLEMLMLVKNAKKVITDSGGLQKEAMFLKTPCITVRDTTEWIETISSKWNVLVMKTNTFLDKEKFKSVIRKDFIPQKEVFPYGRGNAVQKIIGILNLSLK